MTKDNAFKELIKIFCRIQNQKEMSSFLDEILTSSERQDLALRWQLMKMLEEGIPQRQIAADLGISLCKITRGAKILKNSQSISKQYLDSRREK